MPADLQKSPLTTLWILSIDFSRFRDPHGYCSYTGKVGLTRIHAEIGGARPGFLASDDKARGPFPGLPENCFYMDSCHGGAKTD